MVCSKCGTELADGVVFCPNCGTSNGAAPQQQPYYVDPADHTAEFSAKDISDNKIFAMLPYLMGVVGVIVALLASNESPYARFHVRQALKLDVATMLIGFALAILAIIPLVNCIAAIVAVIAVVVLFVIRIISFFSVCSGKAKEPAIVRSLGIFK